MKSCILRLTFCQNALITLFLPVLFIVQTSHVLYSQTRSRDMRRASRGFVSEWPQSASRWALVIGVDQYRDKQISPLIGAANDAKLLAEALIKNAGFPVDQVILLTSDQPDERQPSRVNILRRLSNLTTIVPKDGLFLLAFAGHGIERGGQAFLLPSDAQISEDVTFLEDTALSVTRIKDRIKTMNVKQVMMLLDACRNDPTGRADKPNNLTEAYTQGFSFDIRNKEVTAFATLYATSVGQRAYEYTEKRQGYFTWAVVKALNGEAANQRGEVTLAGLVRYLQDIVPKRIGIDLGVNKAQLPFAVIEGYKAEELVIAITPRVENKNNSKSDSVIVDQDNTEVVFWEIIKGSTNPIMFEAYLSMYPKGQYAEDAKERMKLAGSNQSKRPGGEGVILDPQRKTGEIVGKVYDAGTKVPIADAIVTVISEDNAFRKKGITDEDGTFFIANVPSGIYTIKVTQEGYQEDSIIRFPVRRAKTIVVSPPPFALVKTP